MAIKHRGRKGTKKKGRYGIQMPPPVPAPRARPNRGPVPPQMPGQIPPPPMPGQIPPPDNLLSSIEVMICLQMLINRNYRN